jgi:hypothetical protein
VLRLTSVFRLRSTNKRCSQSYSRQAGTGGGFAATATAAPAALPQGEYTELGQRAFSNNQKRIKQALDQYAIGDSSLVMTQQTLASIGLSDDRIAALIEDVETEAGPTDET